MFAKIRRSLWVGIGVIVAAGAFVAPLVASQQKVSATQYEVDGKVTICHRTDSNENSNNPYNQITVSINATGNNGLGDHYDNHQDNLGVVIYNNQIHAQMKDAHEKWGDIIPPTTAHPSGLNWTAAGQAVWNNGCNYANVADASVSVTPATCDMGAKLVYGQITNATWDPSSTPDGTTGVAPGTPYSVTAIANANALFSLATTTKVMSGNLPGEIGYQNTNPQADCYKTVPAAVAAVSVTPATCDTAAKLVWGGITHAVFSGTADGTSGPASYDVTATALAGYTFAGGELTQSFTGTLAGEIGYQSTDPQADCYKPPVELPRDAAVVLGVTEPTCFAGAKLTFATVDNADFTSGDAAGVEGPRSYSSTFTAATGHLFADGQTTTTKTGTLAGPLTEGCNPEVTLATAGVKINPATCKLGETISYVNVKNATVREGSTAEGVHADTFTVTFDAVGDAVFNAEGAKELVVSDKLAGPSTAPSCEEGQVLGDTETPNTPAQLPKTSGEGTTVIAISGSLLAIVGGVVALRRFFDRGL